MQKIYILFYEYIHDTPLQFNEKTNSSDKLAPILVKLKIITRYTNDYFTYCNKSDTTRPIIVQRVLKYLKNNA